MPRFTLKTLFLSTTLIAVGIWLGMLSFDALYVNRVYRVYRDMAMLLWVSSGVMIGAGLCVPLNRPKLGAIVGGGLLFAAFILEPVIV
jgi:hypothetical protein